MRTAGGYASCVLARAMPPFRPAPRGFSMLELAASIVIIAILTGMGLPAVTSLLNRARVNQAAVVVAADLQNAFAMAARQRKPVRLSCDCANGVYTAADRSGGTLRLTRNLLGDDESGAASLVFDPSPVDIFPSGVTSADLLTVTISRTGYSRQVTMTRAGQVRILRP
jgi:prepilin-type N-terminal cleavage/methylation domain-containing protein